MPVIGGRKSLSSLFALPSSITVIRKKCVRVCTLSRGALTTTLSTRYQVHVTMYEVHMYMYIYEVHITLVRGTRYAYLVRGTSYEYYSVRGTRYVVRTYIVQGATCFMSYESSYEQTLSSKKSTYVQQYRIKRWYQMRRD